jgi:glycosyltransferase involved in cell wall biosynthesis
VYGGGRVAPHVRAIDTHKPGLNLKRAGRHADAGGVEDHDFDRLLEEAEALFGAGDTTAARRSFDALAERWACQPLRLSRVLNDLGVIASMSGDADAARSHLARAVTADPANAGALENLGAVCRADGDDAQAAHWLRRAREVAPGVESIRDALVDILERTHAWEEAAALRPPPGGPSRLLILTHAFHPSVGGTEMLAEQAAVALRDRGWEVEVGTDPNPARTFSEHRGLRVHELPDDGGTSLAALVAARPYDAILSFAGAVGWPIVHTPTLPQPRPRLVLVPCINLDGYTQIDSNPALRTHYAGLLRHADVVVHSSRHGWDHRLMRELGIRSTYVPNAALCVPPARDPMAPSGSPRLLCVGNLWEEKNHAGLLATLAADDGDWSLRIIGGEPPASHPSAAAVRALAAADARVALTGPAPAGEVAAAMAESDMLLLPSRVEATPLVLVEAMSHGLPWIATPTCGSAADHAGGLIVPLDRFPDAIRFLLSDDEARSALGPAGRAHYDAAYSWDVVGERFHALLSGVDALDPAVAPSTAIEATARTRARYYDSLLGVAAPSPVAA